MRSFGAGTNRFGRVGRRLAVGAVGALTLVAVAPPAVAHADTPSVVVSEVAPWGSSTAAYGADWWELTNTGASPVTVTGWKMDDNSNSFALAVALNGVTTIPAGGSAVFIEGTAATATAFETAWFGASVPAGFQIGFYSGSGVGLSATTDAVNIFDSTGARLTGVSFGASTTGKTFDNTAGLGSTTLPLPTISTLSVVGTNGAFLAANDSAETGSPGLFGATPPPDTPEVPYTALLPLSALAVGGAVVLIKRRKAVTV